VDPEGDPVAYTYAWEVNGNPFGLVADTLPPAATSQGDEWTCTVTPSDGVLDGPTGSDTVGIGAESAYGFSLDIGLDASGGALGGAALVDYEHEMLDSSYNTICSVTFEFISDYTYGTAQGDDYWTSIDEVVTWTSGTETSNTCPAVWQLYDTDPVVDWQWQHHPLAFVSCDSVLADPGLGATYLGEDDYGYIPTVSGDFGDYCVTVGPQYQGALGSGPIEGIWLFPTETGMLDALGTWGYFNPPVPDNVDTWALMGLVMADAGNANEPVAGMDGNYVLVPFWLWAY